MTFNDSFVAADFINRNHISFAGRTTYPIPTNPNAFNALMRGRCFLDKEPAARALTFKAQLNDGTNTEITVTPVGNDGWTYIERPDRS